MATISDVVRRPNDRMFASARLEHQLTQTQLMRVEFRHEMNERENLGVGDFDLQDRAYDRTTTDNALRFSLNGLLMPKVANELKVQYSRDLTTVSSLSNEPAIVVIDSFSSGGAGQQNDRRGRLLEIEDNIDFQIGRKHRMRTGFLLEGMWYRSDELRNGNGTWTFGSLTQYEFGLAATYTQRVGTTLVDYSQYQGGIYVQDDYTPSKKLSLSFGLRYEVQSHLDDRTNLAPRVGFTWTPGKYTVRGGYGIFNDWYDSSTYEQTLRVNGVTQQDLVVQNPLYPDTTGGALANPLPPSKYHGGARPADAVSAPGVDWRRTDVHRDIAIDGELHGDARAGHAARREHQRAGDRRTRSDQAGSDVWATSTSSSRPAGPRSIGWRSTSTSPSPRSASSWAPTTSWHGRITSATARLRCRQTTTTCLPSGDRRCRTCGTGSSAR